MSFQEPFATKVKIEFKINLASFSYASVFAASGTFEDVLLFQVCFHQSILF